VNGIHRSAVFRERKSRPAKSLSNQRSAFSQAAGSTCSWIELKAERWIRK